MFLADKTRLGWGVLALWIVLTLIPPLFVGKTRRQIRYRARWYVAALASGLGLSAALILSPVSGAIGIAVMVLTLWVGQQIGRYEAHAEGAPPPQERFASDHQNPWSGNQKQPK